MIKFENLSDIDPLVTITATIEVRQSVLLRERDQSNLGVFLAQEFAVSISAGENDPYAVEFGS